MFKYRFVCSDEGRIRSNIKQMMDNDLPCGRSIFGGDLYRSGVHFQECGEVIKGFYLAESENLGRRGSPIRVSFSGRFVRGKDDACFFEVYIYPRIPEALFLIFAFLFLSYVGKVVGFAIAASVLLIFAGGYYKMIKEACNAFNRIFS